MATGSIKPKITINGAINAQKSSVNSGNVNSGGISDHNRLINRDQLDQHPIEAITGLRQELDDKLDGTTVQPIIEQLRLDLDTTVAKKAAGLFYDANKELNRKSYWYITSEIDPKTRLGTKQSIISGPYDLGMGGGGSGGSGGGSGITDVKITNTDPENLENMWPQAVAVGATTIIRTYWTSMRDGEATGNGTVYFYVNNALVSKKSAKQGYVEFDATNYIVSGDNKIEVKVIDAYSTTKNLIANVTGVSLKLTSNFDDEMAYTGAITYIYTPIGDILKTVHFIIDDNEFGTQTVKATGEQQNFVINGLPHGPHKLRVYFTAKLSGDEVRSNTLIYDLVCFEPGNQKPIIASVFEDYSEQEQYVTFNLPYRVYTPNKNLSQVMLYIDGKATTNDPVEIDSKTHIWSYRPLDIGNHILKISTGVQGTNSYVERSFNIHVNETRIDVEAATQGLALNLNAFGRSNDESAEERIKWEDKDHGVSCSLTGFNWTSNGWMQDKDGNTMLRVAGTARVEIPYKPFAKDFLPTGKTFELEIATSDVKSYTAKIIECLSGAETVTKSNPRYAGEDTRTKKYAYESVDDAKFIEKVGAGQYREYKFRYNGTTWTLDGADVGDLLSDNEYGIVLKTMDLSPVDPTETSNFLDGDSFTISYDMVGRGFYATPQLTKLQSQQTALQAQYKENEHVRISFTVEKRQENKLICMYINGVMSGVATYPASDVFVQAEPSNIFIGTSDATVDIYTIRIYDNNLTRRQIVNNWIADTQDVILKAERFTDNDIYDDNGSEILFSKIEKQTTPYMVLTGPALPSYKGDKRPLDVEFIYPGDDSRYFKSEQATANVQGTSSQYYYRKNFKIKFNNGFMDKDENVSKKYKITPIAKKEKTFTFKADVASSEGTNNVELVRYFEDTKNWYMPAELQQDPDDTIDGYETKDRIRTGIDGFPIVMFSRATEDSNPVFYGKMNFNNDKANDSTFGFDYDTYGDEA